MSTMRTALMPQTLRLARTQVLVRSVLTDSNEPGSSEVPSMLSKSAYMLVLFEAVIVIVLLCHES